MTLKELLRRQGSLLFRWRGYLPLLLLPLAVAAAAESGYFFARFGAPAEAAWQVFCLAISGAGLLLRILTVGFVPAGTSGRGVRQQRAAALNTTGLYSIVRNPLYLGNFVVLLGFALAIKVWWFVLLAGLVFTLYYERIICAEEAFLEQEFASSYAQWAARTPAFIPDPRLWQRPSLGFSLRTALRREHNGFFLIVVFFAVNEIAYDLLVRGQPFAAVLGEDQAWLLFLGVGTLIFLLLKYLKRRTRWLNVPGR